MPSLNTFSSLVEILITIGVLVVIAHNFLRRGFLMNLALGVALFEFGINLVSVLIRMKEISVRTTFPQGLEELAVSHAILAVASYVLWVILAVMAYHYHKKGRYFFREMFVITASFIVLWLVTFACGEYLFLKGA